MSSKVIDNRVVSMEFDNSKFEKNVQTSMKTLNDLNKTIDSLPDTAGKGLDNVSKAASRVDLSGISSGIDALNHKFSALGIAGQEVIRDITRSAIQFGKNAWNMTFGQITSGGKRRATNITQAKFTLDGMGLDFEKYSDAINYAVDGTAYGFDQAAKAASIFASSGVQAGDDMKRALRGISGVAAMTNSSFDEIAYVFEQVNGVGKVTGNTLNMISGRGLNAAAALGKALGKTEEEIHKMVTKGQIDFATFAKAMDDSFGEHSTAADKTLTGVTDNIRAQLSKIGEGFYLPLMENDSPLVKMLQSVKQKVKDLRNITDPFAAKLADTVLDIAGRAKILIDAFDMNKFKPIFDGLTKFLEDAKVGLSFSNAIAGIKELTKALAPLKKAGQEAFREVFTKKINIGSSIFDLSKKLAKFGKYFTVSADTVDKFKRVLKGAFSIVSLGIKIFKDLLSAISPVTDKLKDFGGALFSFLAKVGDFFTQLNQNYDGNIFKALRETLANFTFDSSVIDTAKEKIFGFFDSIKSSVSGAGGGISGVAAAIKESIKGIIDSFSELTGLDIGGFIDGIQEKFEKLKDIFKSAGDFVSEHIEILAGRLKKVANFFSPIIEPLKGIAGGVVKIIGTVLQKISDVLNKGFSADSILRFSTFISLLGSVVTNIFRVKASLKSMKSVTKAAEKLPQISVALKNMINGLSGAPGSIKAFFDQAKKSLKEFNKEIIADSLKKVAISIAILAGAMLVLSSIPTDKLMGAAAAIGELMVAVGGLMFEMSRFGGGDKGTMMQVSSIGTAMIKIAAAVLILANAMKQIDGLEHVLDDMLVVIIFMLSFVAVAKAIQVLEIESFNKVATSMILMSVAIKILASAMTYFDGMQWENVIQGIVSIVAMLVVMVGAAVIIDKFVGNGVFNKVAVGMIVFAAAVKMMASAVQALGSMPAEELANGLGAMVGLLATMTLFGFALDKLMGATDFVKIGAGFLLLGVSIRLIASAFKTLSEIDSDGMTQAIVVLTFTLLGLTAIMVLANDAILKTGAGLMMVAAAMLIFTASIAILGNMDGSALLKGIIALAAGLTVLGVALYFIQGSIVGAAALLILSVALIPFAAAMAILTALDLADLAGTMLVLVVALAALAAVCYGLTGAIIGAAALLVLSVALLAFGVACTLLVALPLKDLALTLGVVLVALLAFGALSAVLAPVLPLMLALAGVMAVLAVGMLALGAGMMMFSMSIQTLSTSGVIAAEALGVFCGVLGDNLGVLTKGAVALHAIALALLVLDAALIVAAVSLAACAVALLALASAMVIFSAAAIPFSAALLLISASLKQAIKNLTDMLSESKFRQMAGNAIDGIKKGFKDGITKVKETLGELGKAAIEKIKSFFGGGADSEMGKAGANGVSGFIAGIKSKLADVKKAASTLGSSFLAKLKGSLKEKSPSKATMEMGEYADEGFIIGVKKDQKAVENAAEDLGDSALDAMSAALSNVNDALNSDLDPTLTPVLNLSEVQKGARTMNGLLNTNQAATISANYTAGKLAELDNLTHNQQRIDRLGSKIDELSKALLNMPTPEVNTRVELVGDADGVFRLMRQEDNRYTKMHGKSAFA